MRFKRIHINIDEKILSKLDKYGESVGIINRSGLIRMILRKELKGFKGGE